MSRNRNDDFVDDGRTIADMSNVETPHLLGFRSPRRDKKPPTEAEKLDRRQTRSYIFGAMLAGLLIAGIFIAAGAVAIALMVTFWK